MVNIENTSTIIATIVLLILFMFFGVNLAMVALERKVSLSSLKLLLTGAAEMLRKKDNPNSYRQARVYLSGSLLSLLALMAFLEFGYA